MFLIKRGVQSQINYLKVLVSYGLVVASLAWPAGSIADVLGDGNVTDIWWKSSSIYNLGATNTHAVTNTVSVPMKMNKAVAYNYPSGNAVFFHNSNGWTTPTVHLWEAVPAGSHPNTLWPGTAMNDFGGLDLVYMDIGSATSGNVVFSNNGNNQTGDLSYNSNTPCYKNGTWMTLQDCGVGVKGNEVFFHNSDGWTTPTAHLWEAVPAGSHPDTLWPGTAMNDFGSLDLVYVDIGSATSGNVIFSNSGNNQTGDLSYNSNTPCYKNGTWMTLQDCGVVVNSAAQAGPDSVVNKGVRFSLSAAGSTGDTTGAVWSSNAWSGSLTGASAVTPVLNNAGSFTVTLTLANGDSDTLQLDVVEATQGLAERPLLSAPLSFPLTGKVDTGNYVYESAFPNLEGMFVSPVMVENDGVNQNLIYVVDKPGQLYVFPNDPAVTQSEVIPLLDANFHQKVRDHHEQGLLSVAFHPNFSSNRLIYLFYVEYTGNDSANNDYNTMDPNWNGSQYDSGVLVRVRLNDANNPTGVEPNSLKEILRIPSTNPDHKGGKMGFHPSTGEFFMSIGEMGYGDSATPNPTTGLGRVNPNAQDLTTLRGSFIRVNMLEGDTVDPGTGTYYTIPTDNPFANTSDGTRKEIWSYGHRNPWRWAFDTVPDLSEAPENQYTLWEGEIGQDGSTRYEEVNIIRKGENYGWPICEGTRHRGGLGGDHANSRTCVGDLSGPTSGYGNEGGVSIIAGFVYRGDKLPAMKGKFIFGDYFQKTLWTIEKGQDKEVLSNSFPAHLSSFGTDVAGEEIFISTHGIEHGGPSIIYRVELDDTSEVAQIPLKLSQTGIFADLAGRVPVHGVIEYELNSHGWFDGAVARHFLAVPNGERINAVSNGQWDLPVGSVLIKHLDLPISASANEPYETSVLFKKADGSWEAANYAWNANGTDADLIIDTQININKQQWIDGSLVSVNRRLRNGAACGSCHNGSGSKDPRDMEFRQLDREFDYQGFTDNQTTVFSAIGLLSGSAGSAEAFVDPANTNADLQERALVYLDTNCSSCHFGGSSGNGMDYRYDTPLADRHLLNESGRLIPFDHASSRIYIQQTSDSLRMPLESELTNPVAQELFQVWIDAADVAAQGPTSFSVQADQQVDVAPGTQITLIASSAYSNGFTAVPDNGVIWSSSDSNVVFVSGTTGELTVTAGGQGSAIITAQYQGSSADVQISVSGGPAKPDRFTASAVSSTVISLNWVDIADDEINYLLHRATSVNGPYSLLDTLAANTNSYLDDSNLQPSTRYYYELRASNVDGDSLAVSADAITDDVIEVDGLDIVTGVDVTLLTGESRQVVAVAINGSKKTAGTLLATWDSSDNSVASVSGSGVITGGNVAGTATITANIDGTSDSIVVTNKGAGKYVYFNRPSAWNDLKIHVWKVEGGTSTPVTGAWPGAAMTPAFEYGGNWYRYAILAGDANSAGETNIIFNCGSADCQTADLTTNQTGSSWYDDTAWLAQAPIGSSGTGGTQIQVLRGQVTFSGSDNLSTRQFPLGATLNVSADAAAAGQTFAFWQGAGVELMVNPSSPNTSMIIDGALSYSLSAIMDTVTDEHVLGRSFYNDGQLCTQCHGSDGAIPVGSGVNLVNIGDRYTLAELINIIETTMPQGNASACKGECARSIAEMLLVGAFFPPQGLCSANDLEPQDRSYRLLTKLEYNNSIRDLFGRSLTETVNVTDGVPDDVPANDYFTNANMLFTSSYASAYITAAQQAAGMIGNIYNLVSCNSGDVNCFISQFGKKAFRRPLTSAESNSLRSVHNAEGDSALLAAILSSPAMLLRSEVGELITSGSNAGYYQLTDYEVASFLSYTYWATTPNDLLMQAADAGQLSRPSDIADMVGDMLNDPRADATFERFVLGWLGLDRTNPVPDADLSRSLKEAMKQETIDFVRNIVFSGGTYEELITADYSYMNQELANHYGLTWPGGSGVQQVYYPSTGPNSERRGVLGHGSILSVNSAGQKTHPVRRGVYVRRSLMCQDFGAPPLGADLDPVTLPNQTVRQRFEEAHLAGPNATPDEIEAKAACGFCHQHIDGIGFGFENYSPLGKWQTQEQVSDGSWVDIDSSGAIGNLNSIETVLISGDETTDYQGLNELADLIAGSSNGKACYARQWYRYTRGQREEPADSCTLDSYGSEFKTNSNTSLLQLMIDYTQTSNFSLRKEQ